MGIIHAQVYTEKRGKNILKTCQGYQHRARRLTESERNVFNCLLKIFNIHLTTFQKKRRSQKYHKKHFINQKMFIDTRYKKGYIADFYLPELKLVFEIDGPSHDSKSAQAYDAVRSSFLAYRGVKVVRIPNSLTEDNQEGLINRIKKEIEIRGKELINKPRRKYIPLKEQETINIDVKTLTEQYLESGKEITHCPTIGHNRKIYQYA